MKSVLTIQSQVAGARVGNSVAVFALERLGVPALALPTALLGRRPDRGAPGGGPMPATVLTSMLDALAAEGALANVAFVLSGYLALPEQADVVLDAVARVKAANPAARYVCDPVMGDAGAPFVKPDIIAAVRDKLVPTADMLTPNLFELELLTGAKCPTLKDAHAAARRLDRPVLVTSAPSESGAATLYVAPTGSWIAETARLPDAPKGVGDLFTALYVARRTLGQSVVVALEAAAGAVHDVIARSLLDGGGHLAIVAAQDKLEHPDTWPTARTFDG
jgi:pyridoxine kinase